MEIPAAFVSWQQRQLGQEETGALLDALQGKAPTSVRLHPTKSVSRWSAAAAPPWESLGRYLPVRPVFALDPCWHAGAYYVQEASSMILSAVLPRLFSDAAPLRVLDMCAAPGGKSTLLRAVLPHNSLLVANEPIHKRYKILREVLTKWGMPGVLTTQRDPDSFARELLGYFDLILVDAPCSGEGMFRREPVAIEHWSTDLVHHCAARQKRILSAAVKCLRPGGILIYTTCTFNDLENEANSAWLDKQEDITYYPIDFPADWGIRQLSLGHQLYPHRLRGEGLYIATFQKTAGREWKAPRLRQLEAAPTSVQAQAARYLAKPDNYYLWPHREHIAALPRDMREAAQPVLQQLKAEPITYIGTPKGKHFVPHPALALSTVVSPTVDRISLTESQALSFLRKEPVADLPHHKGWFLAQYNELGLGWIKLLGHRANNYWPTPWRLRKG